MNDLPFLCLNDTVVRQDARGRYRLNDLHKSAGGLEKHKPANFLRNKETQGIVASLKKKCCSNLSSTFPVNAVENGSYEHRGTYVVWQLVYRYAMWISSDFYLEVIEKFHAYEVEHIRKNDRMERAYFARYPERRLMRRLAYDGEPYWCYEMSKSETLLLAGLSCGGRQSKLRLPPDEPQRKTLSSRTGFSLSFLPEKASFACLFRLNKPAQSRFLLCDVHIAREVRRAAATVGRAIRHMCAWGVMEAWRLAIVKEVATPIMAKLRREQRAERQLAFKF